MATFHYSTLHIRVSTYLKLNALLSQQGLECSIQISLPLSVRIQAGHLRTGIEYFARIEKTELTAAPVLARSGTICRYFEKTSITLNRYLYLSLYLLRDRIFIKSHSQASIIFVTV